MLINNQLSALGKKKFKKKEHYLLQRKKTLTVMSTLH